MLYEPMKRTVFAAIVLGLLLLPVLGDRVQAGGTLADTLSPLPLLRGAPITAESVEDRVVLVAFFASWCPPCKYEFPHLNTVQKAYGDRGLQIIAVNVFETHDGLSTPAKLQAFLEEMTPSFPILKGDAQTRRVFGDLDRIPTMFLFDREGAPKFIFRHAPNAEKTHLSEAELREQIEPLL